jgi:hypothetical protein
VTRVRPEVMPLLLMYARFSERISVHAQANEDLGNLSGLAPHFSLVLGEVGVR